MVPFLLKLQLNTPDFKYALIVVLAPFWLPFVREIWRELNRMLEEEGGLLGRQPSEKQLQAIRARRRHEELALVRDLRQDSAPARSRPPARRGFSGQAPQGAPASTRRPETARGPARGPQRRGFGSSRS